MATKKTTSVKSKTRATATATKPKRKKISAEDIRQRAVEIYQDRMQKGQHGDELSDWLTAEKQLSKSK
jgi:uncharacterized protein YcbX